MPAGIFHILGAASLWGLIGPFSRLAFQEGLGPMEVAFWRAALTALLFGTHAAVRREVRLAPRDVPAVAVFAITGVTLFYASYQQAIREGGAALAAILLYTAPAWVCVLARALFKERITPAKAAALVMTLGGVAAISLSGGGLAHGLRFNWAAVGFGLAAGFCYSMYYIFGKVFSNRYTSPNLFLYMLPLGAVTLAPFVDFQEKTPTAWAALVCISVVSTYGAYYLYYLGVQRMEASRASIAATIEPVVAAVVAWFWWGEAFTLLGYVGSVLVLAAVLLMVADGAGLLRRRGDPPVR